MSYEANWREEKRSAYLYRVLAEYEASTSRGTLFTGLAAAAEAQAQHWEQLMTAGGEAPPRAYLPDPRARLLAWLTRRFGPHRMRAMLVAAKVRGMSLYSTAAGHPTPLSLADVGRRHRGADGGMLRAAVFGVNDGLVSNASLILGVAGAGSQSSAILLAGAAGLVAGAFSMAAGEYISVRSQRELFEYQIGLEREELQQYPQEEAAELALIYQARGVPMEQAEAVAAQIVTDPEKALATLSREELGLNPEELGSPWSAAISSFVAFATGALIPLLPFIFARGAAALSGAMILSAATLFGVGASLSLFTGKGAMAGGARMLAVGAAAGAVTYAIGKWLGVTLG